MLSNKFHICAPQELYHNQWVKIGGTFTHNFWTIWGKFKWGKAGFLGSRWVHFIPCHQFLSYWIFHHFVFYQKKNFLHYSSDKLFTIFTMFVKDDHQANLHRNYHMDFWFSKPNLSKTFIYVHQTWWTNLSPVPKEVQKITAPFYYSGALFNFFFMT